jgi:hypothetical protein
MIQYLFLLRKYSCGIPSENADMSNEKERLVEMTLKKQAQSKKTTLY